MEFLSAHFATDASDLFSDGMLQLVHILGITQVHFFNYPHNKIWKGVNIGRLGGRQCLGFWLMTRR